MLSYKEEFIATGTVIPRHQENPVAVATVPKKTSMTTFPTSGTSSVPYSPVNRPLGL